MSATLHAWAAAGSPPPPYAAAPAAGPCATCGAETAAGVSLDQIETPTTSGHADLFRFGSQHVCPGCAWLFAAGKGRPGNYIAYGQRLEYTVISLESVVDDKRPWLEVLRDVAALPTQTPIAGVMTTDVKPRLWHRARLASVGQFGLLIHAPDYDVSEWRSFDLANQIPWLKIYDDADDPRQARSELAFVAGAGDATRRHGGWAAWKQSYPELFRVWQKKWGIE